MEENRAGDWADLQEEITEAASHECVDGIENCWCQDVGVVGESIEETAERAAQMEEILPRQGLGDRDAES